jgi:hypothetical protein
MTLPSTPTETLVRIPFIGLTDFQPLALAPGLPMLDVNKLTYQVLLGWFGDLLAEPELDDEGIMFHAQRCGTRQVIVERALATSEDLHGTLQPQYEKLKNALFDVRPVSPSERLIFNRLQPPIGNHEGFLYRVQTESGEEQLVWCWGFQRRTQYGDARLCNSHKCSMLFLHDSLADPLCPHCGTSFGVATDDKKAAGSRFPLRKASAAAAVLLLAGGTLWISSQQTNLSADIVSDVANVEPLDLASNPVPYDETTLPEVIPVADEDVSTETAATRTHPADAGTAELTSEPTATEPPELFVGFNDLPSVDEPLTTNDAGLTETAPALPESTLPPIVSLPDLPGTLSLSDNGPSTLETFPDTADEIVLPDPSLPIVKADPFPQDETEETPDLPDVLPEPLVAQSESVTPTEIEDSSLTSVTKPLESNTGLLPDTEPVARPEFTKPALPDLKDSVVLTEPFEEPTVESPAESLSWHSDYVAAYLEASQEKRYLLMLFREAVVGGEPLATTDSVFAPSMRPMLEQFSRVELTLNAAMPVLSDQTNDAAHGELPNLLLKHRSFRHLGMQPGIAVVDLTDTTSPNHARVVSVLRLPENGQFSNDDLMLALNLPKGAIGQRTLLYAIRSTVPDCSLSMREFSPTLIELAHRNSRYMANARQVGNFDQETRKQRIEQDFGTQAELKQLVFATESETSIQDAALQAVTSWIGTSESFDILDAPAEAMGMDMFQDSESGRWFVTCFVIR